MKVAPHIQAITVIRAGIADYRSAAAEFDKDVTLRAANEALAAAEKVKERADLEDDSVDAEELVDRRLEAARQVEVAKIRLARASKAADSRRSDLGSLLVGPVKSATEAITAASDLLQGKLQTGLVRVYGEAVALAEKPFFDKLHWVMGDKLNAEAVNLRQANCHSPESVISQLEHAIKVIEDAYRDR